MDWCVWIADSCVIRERSEATGSVDLRVTTIVRSGSIKTLLSLWVIPTRTALTPCGVGKGILWPGMEHQLLLAQAQAVGYQPVLLLAQWVLSPFGSWEVHCLLQWLLPRKGGGESL